MAVEDHSEGDPPPGRPRMLRASALAVALALGSFPLMTGTAAAADDPATVQALAERYAPFVAVRQQDGPCDSDGEPYEPADVDIVLDNPEVVLRGADGQVITDTPTAADLFEGGTDFHLDYPGNALDPGCTYEQDFDRFNGDRPPLVYAHVAREAGKDGLLALQYWTFWYFNDWNNTHETDWEGIQLIFEADTVEEALDATPIEVGYAQHEGGERHDWDDDALERDGNRVTVYSSAGSHASYFSSDLYLGRGASEGFGCDDTTAPVLDLDPDVVVLPDEVGDPTDPLAWLAYEGHWGEEHGGPYNGPTGPTSKDRWTRPITWQEGLRDSSVVVPGDDTFGPRATDAFCAASAIGSAAFIAILDSPVIALGVLGLLGLLAAAAIRVARPVLREARRLHRAQRRRYVVVGVAFVPIAIITAAAQAVVLRIPGIAPLVDLAGQRGGVSIALALAVGAGGTVLTTIVVQAVVTTLMLDDEQGGDLSALDAYRTVGRHWRQLISATVELFLAVLVLAITVIGLPWAIRQSVRWAFIGPAVAERAVGGRAALRASADAVEGAGWRTASTLAVTTGLALAAGPVVGVALMLITGLPLGLLNTVSSIVYTLTVPMAAIALNLWWRELNA